MPVLENNQHELFAQAIAEGKTQVEAQLAAGMMPDRGNASRLTANDSIKKRVAELQTAGAKRTEITVQRIAEELATIGFAQTATIHDGLKVSNKDKVSALEKLGKWQGMFVDKLEHTSPDGSMSPQEVDSAVVKALVDKLID